MNGSRSHQQTSNQEAGARSSFETLSRTIEGLEARIEGLMEAARDRARASVSAEALSADAASRASSARDFSARVLPEQAAPPARAQSPRRERPTISDRTMPDRVNPETVPMPELAAADLGARAGAIAEIIARQKALLTRSEAVRLDAGSNGQARADARMPAAERRNRAEAAAVEDQSAVYDAPPRRSLREAGRAVRPAAEPSQSSLSRPDLSPPDLAEALVGLRHELKHEIAEGVAREIQSLRGEMRGLVADAGRDHNAARDIRADLQKLSDSIAALSRQAPAGPVAEALRDEFDALRRMMDGLAREESMRRIEGRWSGVEERIVQSDSARDDELVALARRLDELKTQIAAAQSGPAIHALEAKLSRVLDAVDTLAAQIAPADRRLQGYVADLDRRLEDMRLQMGRLNSLGALEGLENRLGGVMDAVEAIAIQMPPNDRRLHSALGDLDGRLLDMQAQIERLSAQPDLATLEQRVAELVSAIETTGFRPDTRLQDQMQALERRLSQVAEEIGALDSAAALAAVEGRLVTLAQAVDVLSRQIRPGDAAVQAQFSALDQRLDEITRAIVAGGRSASDAAAVSRVEARLGDLSRQIEAIPSPAAELAERIEDLAARMDALSREDAAARLEARLNALAEMLQRAEGERREGGASQERELSRHLLDISRKIDALEAGAGHDALADRLDGLARRIEALNHATGEDEARFARLEQRLGGLAERIEAAQAAPVDDAMLRGLHQQIAGLSDLLRSPRDAGGLPAEMESRMHALEDYLSTSDEYIIEAARQAAEAVMDSYGRGNGAPVAGGDMAAIAALADDLKTLEDMSRSSQEQTARTFESLHETLVDIVGKLERLEQPAATLRPPEMPAARDAAAASPRIDAPVSRDSGEALPVLALLRDEAEARESETESGRAGLMSGLARRFAARKAESTAARPMLDTAPSLDPADLMGKDVANELLEPGSGVPDVKTILARVRAGQQARGPQAEAERGETTDFIAAARRAAQLAAEEVQGLPQDAQGLTKGGRLARHRKPILIAVGAILMAILAYPLAGALIGGDKSTPVPPAVIDAPKQAAPAAPQDAPDAAQKETAPAAPSDGASSTLSSPETQAPAAATPDGTGEAGANAPDAAAGPAQAARDPAEGEATDSAPVTFGRSAPVTPVTTVAVTPPAAAQADQQAAIEVPAEIGPPALADAARAGDPLAFFQIGANYTDGRGGVAVDLAKAAQWYQRAADAGFAPAQYRLGSLYEKGSGVPQDFARARTLYEAAAEKGNANAMHNLAVLIAGGRAGTPDFASAAVWFQKAAEHGVRDSQFNLAILYARGNGVRQDLKQSWAWFDAAAAQGDPDAAQKRDDVAKVMKPADLESARAQAAAFKPVPLDATANEAVAPDAWLGKAQPTGSVDMKKAIRNIQAILNNNGFDAGRPDGEIGAKTVSAIKAFQTSIGQAPTGQITDQLVHELLKRNARQG
ncbi:hypothetical protein BJF92_00275 [Rhizobium rhizosphaerae]|uniref:Peptidoglycan binding-like domain-containing protein n=1 Tax=Xaviernesmea rhizosphaerae TaxID=1672749 RepID=A0A1Q9AE66_9HYPH|nr:peptidoglycan-binding protein [Xaviernesmea rhizosphaerae]OLP53245.1 hypothetical protein BJF92_00275 [Xaviernesmea rhizosphaerae]